MNGINGNVKTAIELGFKILIALYVPLLIWMGGILIGLSNRITAIEANKFTATDGSEIWQALAVRPTFDEVPPLWFREEVQRLHDAVEDLRAEIRQPE